MGGAELFETQGHFLPVWGWFPDSFLEKVLSFSSFFLALLASSRL